MIKIYGAGGCCCLQLFVKRAATGLLAEVSLQQGGVLRPHLWAEPTAAAATGDAAASLCTCTVHGGDYRGPLNTTVSGFACQVGVYVWVCVWGTPRDPKPQPQPDAPRVGCNLLGLADR